MRPKISIAMATYNGAKFLNAQLQSIAAQTVQPDELVITDDCSSDTTLEIIKNFSESVPFTVIWSQNTKRLGYCGNFNSALLKTTGDLVFLSDQDDVWFEHKIERMSSIASVKESALVLLNDAAITDTNLKDTGLTKLGQIRSAGFRDNKFIMGCCVVIKRELLDICLPIPTDYPSHDDWIVRIGDGLSRKHIVTDIFQSYRRHGDNESEWIANNTTRITRRDAILADLRTYFHQSSHKSKGNIGINQTKSTSSLRLLLEWTHEVAQKKPEILSLEIKIYQEKLKNEINARNQRDLIKQQGFVGRILSVFNLWRVGGYKEFSGFQTAIRDILLP